MSSTLLSTRRTRRSAAFAVPLLFAVLGASFAAIAGFPPEERTNAAGIVLVPRAAAQTRSSVVPSIRIDSGPTEVAKSPVAVDELITFFLRDDEWSLGRRLDSDRDGLVDGAGLDVTEFIELVEMELLAQGLLSYESVR